MMAILMSYCFPPFSCSGLLAIPETHQINSTSGQLHFLLLLSGSSALLYQHSSLFHLLREEFPAALFQIASPPNTLYPFPHIFFLT